MPFLRLCFITLAYSYVINRLTSSSKIYFQFESEFEPEFEFEPQFESEFEFEHGRIRRVSETTLAAKIITNQIKQQSSTLSQKSEIKIARSKRSNGNKASNIETQNNAPTPSSDQQSQVSLGLNNMVSQQHSKDELMSIIKIQDQKIQNLTNRVNNLEQLVHEWQSDALLSQRTSVLLAREIDHLKQYSIRSCLVISHKTKTKKLQ